MLISNFNRNNKISRFIILLEESIGIWNLNKELLNAYQVHRHDVHRDKASQRMNSFALEVLGFLHKNCIVFSPNTGSWRGPSHCRNIRGWRCWGGRHWTSCDRVPLTPRERAPKPDRWHWTSTKNSSLNREVLALKLKAREKILLSYKVKWCGEPRTFHSLFDGPRRTSWSGTSHNHF